MATILIVEDHAISRQMLGNLLGYKGHRVLEAADGAGALALARRERPDLVVTDVVMPRVDGLELVRRLRADPGLASTPAIFYTAASVRTGAQHLEDVCGNCRVLAKPSDPEVILRVIDEALGVVPAGAIPKPASAALSMPAKFGRQRGTELKLAVLIDLGFHLVKQREPTALLNTFCLAIREILGCTRSLVVVEGDGRGEASYYTGGDATEAWPARLMPQPAVLERLRTRLAPVRWRVSQEGGDGESSAGSTAPQGAPDSSRLRRSADLAPQGAPDSSRLRRSADLAESVVLAAPFATPSRAYGYFLLADKKDGAPFDDQDEEISVALGAQTALGYENILLFGKLQKQSAELRLSEERLRLLVEGVKDYGIVMLDPEGGVVSWNSGAEDLTGWRADEVRGRHYSCLFPPDKASAAKARRELEVAGITGQYREEGERVRKDGSRFWADVTLAAVRDAEGQLRGFAKVLRDITERKQAEDERERSRQSLSRLAEVSRRVVGEMDREGMLRAVAEAALELTGARVAACGHGHVTGQFIIGGSARVPAAPACPEGKTFLIEKGGVYLELLEGADSIRLTDDQLRAHSRWWGLPADHVPMRGLLGARLSGQAGKANGMLLVTDKEQGEFTAEDESLLRQLATLASLALQHIEARTALEESDRQKNQFLGVLSHELRNPLAPIRNSLFILERAEPGGEQALHAKRVIDRQVAHMSRLVDDLLDMTRISRGMVQLKRERLDACDVARRAAEDHRSTFARNGLELALDLPERPLWIDGDQTRVAQIIGNLLHNSAKFTEAGGKVSLLVEESASLQQAIIRVRDTGIGIAPEMAPRLFDGFTQADTTLDRGKSGLGLGLALVKGLVEMHGGTVSVESEGLGKGAEFTVCVPLEAARTPVVAPVRRAASSDGARRVLVIEDNVDSADSLRDVLALRRHTVEVAYSGAEGLEKARSFKPDVVLCDIGLPVIDGYEVARTMRADPELGRIPLIALTGYALTEDVARARAAGFDGLLAKPADIDALERVLSPLGRDGGTP
jgi:PAS domain S-box-containing protein